MQFADLNNRHAGLTCWICGTGPSLERLNYANVAGPLIALNRAAFVMPAYLPAIYWLVLDDAWGLNVHGPWNEHLQSLSWRVNEIGVFRDPLLARDRLTPAPRGENIVTFHVMRERHREQVLELNRGQLAQLGQLYGRIGAAAPAVHLAWYLGCERVVLAGIDGTTGQAGCVQRFYGNQESSDYSTAKKYALKAAQILGMDVIDLSTRLATEPQGHGD
jgi:hypothetical protein